MQKESTPEKKSEYKWDIQELKKIAIKINKYEREEFEREEKTYKRTEIERNGLKSQTCPS